MSRFQVLFSGDLVDGANQATVRQNLMRRLGLDERKVSQLFSGRTVVVRSDLAREAADALQADLAQLGAIARIKDTSPDDKPKFKIDTHADQTLKDITAAHIACPRCGYLQLESEYCARCGVDIATAMKQKRKEDLLIEKKIRGLKVPKSVQSLAAPGTQSVDPAPADAVERLQPIRRRAQRSPQTQREQSSQPDTATGARATRTTELEAQKDGQPAANPFGGGFWRNMLKLGRKGETKH